LKQTDWAVCKLRDWCYIPFHAHGLVKNRHRAGPWRLATGLSNRVGRICVA